MDDLVTRLEEQAEAMMFNDCLEACTMREAAAELAKLRAELAGAREALERIADDLGEQFLDWVEYGCEGKDAIRLVSHVSQFARAALKGPAQ
jgi:hypothetical protein